MGKSLEQYAAEHPTAEPEQERRQREQTLKDYHERQQERQEVDRLKEGILSQLKQGTEPQYILYPALKAIGILTNDKAWTQQGQDILDSIYEDLGQQSLLVDNEAVAAERLKENRREFNEKLRKQTEAQLRKYKAVERALYDTLKAIQEAEQGESTEDFLT